MMQNQNDAKLAEDMGSLWNDPLGFVKYGYQWNHGELEGFHGPEKWQESFMREWGEEITLRNFDGVKAVDPILESTVAGRGVGKSTESAWIADFIMSTRPHSKGVMTANTSSQLETKTWAEVAKWTRRCITAHWFRVTTGRGAMKMVHRDFEDSWRVDALAWREDVPEAFAGLHAVSSTPWYLFDEASAIPINIINVALGGLILGEPMIFLFGNGTKNSGFFYNTHNDRDMMKIWKRHNVDSRESSMSNKTLIDMWIKEHGIDSDFVKIHVLGQFPNQSTAQLISGEYIERARRAEARFDPSDPLIMGVDVGRFGGDPSVFRFRRGRDARSIPPQEYQGQDTMWTAGKIAEANETYAPDAIFVDGNGLGGGVVDRCRQLGVDVIEVNSSFRPFNRDYRIKGDEMWGNMRDDFRDGIAIDDHDDLIDDLRSREYFFDNSGRIALESKDDMKSRGLKSPNHGDALGLTYAYPVGPRDRDADLRALMRKHLGINPNKQWDYDPHAEDRLNA